MKGKVTGLLLILLGAGLSAAMLFTGCESSTTDANITVTPASETRSSGQDTHVLLTATGSTNLYLPLEWSVSNPDLGRILETAGNSAVYESFGIPGNNVITVKDQGTAEGVAVIYWQPVATTTTPATP